MKRKGINIIILGLASIILIGCIAFNLLYKYVKPINSGVTWDDTEVSEEENNLYNFITTDLMTSDYGIKTNYNNEESQGEITKGHTVLSESEGLMLLYYLDTDNREGFDNIMSYVKDKMLMENGLLRWRVGGDEPVDNPSTIDDLRICKALLLASEKWDDINYRKTAFKISNGIKKELLDGSLLADFKDSYGKSNKTKVCYLDILALRLLASLDNDYKDIYSSSLNLLDDALVSTDIPLYKTEYDRTLSEFDSGNLDMELNSVVLLNRAEAGLDISQSINYLKKKYAEDNGIFSLYDLSGKAVSNIEATDIYANLLQAASLAGDYELYEICRNKIEAYQVKDPNSLIFGAYGDTVTYEVHSFNNLNALLSWRKIKK